MSDITVIFVSACVLAVAASFRWHRRFAMSWREPAVYDATMMIAVMGVAARLPKAIGQDWFAERLTAMDNVVLLATFLVSLEIACSTYNKLPPERRPLRGRWWCQFYLWRNATYIGLAYLYLTKLAEMLLRSLGVDPAGPVLALKALVLVGLLGTGTRIAGGVRAAPQRPVGPLGTRG